MTITEVVIYNRVTEKETITKSETERSDYMIREARLKKGLTQKDLAEVLQVTETAISRYETGKRKPRGEIAIKLSEILDIPIEKIIV